MKKLFEKQFVRRSSYRLFFIFENFVFFLVILYKSEGIKY